MIEFYGDNKIKKASSHIATLLKLRRFLNAKEPTLVYFLTTMWDAQRKAITYKELREAIMADVITTDWMAEWQQDYSAFVVEHLVPIWMEAMAKSAEQLERRFNKFYFNPMADGVQEWVQTYGAAFVTNSTQTQIDAIRSVIHMATELEDFTVDELAKAIRPTIGLTKPQAEANLRYYKTMREYGLSADKAREKSLYYAGRQNRQRGYTIARTELAHGYNKGEYLAIKDAQRRGYLGRMEKIWCTADDERVCPTCGPMDGKRIALDAEFNFNTKLDNWTRLTPPLHPNCRCAVLYEEVAPPLDNFMDMNY